MRKSFLSNERIILRAMEPEDLEMMYEMENDPSLWEISSFSAPYSRYVLRQYIESTQYDIFADKQLRLIIVRRADDARLGTIDITDFTAIHSRGGIGIAIRGAYRGQGYGNDALQLLCEYAFEFLSIHQLYAHVEATNTQCVQLFTRCGFTKCGILRHWLLIEGQWRDALLLQKINS
jgi:diamine N-acetyltransferase